MLSRMFQLLRTCPVTWLLLFVCPLLWAFDMALSVKLAVRYEAASSLLGAADEFSLWDGEWWRVITTAFHHGGFVHLLCNMSFIGLTGRALEFRMGSFYYFVFCLVAIAVSGVVQSLWGPYVGLSGLGFAQFGLIWIWRKRDKWWQDQVSDQMIQSGFVWLVACFVIDGLGIMPIGNVAHATGLMYGCLVAVTRYGSQRAKVWWPIVICSHLTLVPGFYFVTHPIWNGRYQWRCGDLAENPRLKIKHYENALRQNPDLDGPWINLALIYLEKQEVAAAWRYIIRGLARHPSSEKMIQVAREVARGFTAPHDRVQARQLLEQVFGESAKIWEEKLLAEVPLHELKQLNLPETNRTSKPGPLANGEIEEPLLPELPTILPRNALDDILLPGKKLPAPDPNAPGSAEEGRAA